MSFRADTNYALILTSAMPYFRKGATKKGFAYANPLTKISSLFLKPSADF